MRRQRGAFLAIMAILIVVLLGFAALAIDVGRLLVLRSEMQNAVDSAALAAAFQLDSSAGAIERARIAARNALEHNSHFARERSLLNEETLPDEAFIFFCIIGSRFDIDADDASVDLSHFCGNTTAYAETGADARKYEATGDADAHYVRVHLAASDSAVDNFTLDLIFYPVIRLLGAENIISQLSLEAVALAGRGFFACNFPPMAICDPFEGEGGFRENMTEGAHIILKQQSPGWSPGNAGFLNLGSPGASSVSNDLADESSTGCSPPVLTTAPGGMTNKMKSAINTRFGVYKRTGADEDDIFGDQYDPVDADYRTADADTYPAAPNVMNYPLDQTTHDDDRFGNGDWLCGEYWLTHHLPTELPPTGCLINSITRWDVYNHEISNTLPIIQEDDDLTDDPERAKDADSSDSAQHVGRRRFFVGVLSCNALGVAGNTTVPVFSPDGFAEIFIIAPATAPNHPDGAQIFGEFIGWGDEDEEGFHVNVQLYE